MQAGGDPLKVELMSAGELTALAADTSGGLRAGIVALQVACRTDAKCSLTQGCARII